MQEHGDRHAAVRPDRQTCAGDEWLMTECDACATNKVVGGQGTVGIAVGLARSGIAGIGRIRSSIDLVAVKDMVAGTNSPPILRSTAAAKRARRSEIRGLPRRISKQLILARDQIRDHERRIRLTDLTNRMPALQ